MAWPAWEVRLLAEFLSKEPSGEDRIEIAIANLSAMYANAHKANGRALSKATDFLFFRDAWKSEEEASLSEIVQSLGGVKRAPDHH